MYRYFITLITIFLIYFNGVLTKSYNNTIHILDINHQSYIKINNKTDNYIISNNNMYIYSIYIPIQINIVF